MFNNVNLATNKVPVLINEDGNEFITLIIQAFNNNPNALTNIKRLLNI